MTLARILIIGVIVVIILQGVVLFFGIKYVADNGVKNVVQRIWDGSPHK